MTQDQTRQELLKKIQEFRTAISDIRRKMNDIAAKKEAAFKEKDGYSQQIGLLISAVKEAKVERDKLTGQVRDSKGKRNEFNEAIRKKVVEIKALEIEKKRIRQQFKFSADPTRIKEEIDKLEYIIETEAPSPNEEKRIMQKIKEKKKLYDEAKKGSGVFDKIHQLSKELQELRKKSDDAHRKVRNSAEGSQQQHESLLESSHDVRSLRQKEQEAHENATVYKALFGDLSRQLREKLKGLAALQKDADDARAVNHEEHRKHTQSLVRQRQADVEKKLARGEKLTTEDLILMQG